MKPIATIVIVAAFGLSLAGCGGKGDDTLGSQVEAAADNRADALDAAADNLHDRAEAVRDNGEDRAEAIDDADVNAHALTNGQKAEIVNGNAVVAH